MVGGPSRRFGGPSRISESRTGLSRRAVSGREALSEVQKWSDGPLGGSVVVGRPSGRSGSVRETLLEVRKRSGGPHSGPVVDGKPVHRSGSVRETLLEVREW